MITKNSDFIGPFYIANSEDEAPNSDLLGNTEQLQVFINSYEKKCLITVLGYKLYAELVPELEKKPFNPAGTADADQKWVDLVNGKDNYFGLKPVLVPYIYFYFLQSDQSSHTGVGIVRETPKGAVSYSPREKGVKAWRAFHEATAGKYSEGLVIQKYSVGGIITGIFYDASQDDKIIPLYRFLELHAEDYPNANPSIIGNINEYGI